MRRKMRTATVEAIVGAVYDRAQGMPFSKTMDKWELVANQLFSRVCREDNRRKLQLTMRMARGFAHEKIRTVDDVVSDEGRRRNLFLMDEDYLREQYELVASSTRKRFSSGTFMHDENVGLLMYIALSYRNPELAEGNRVQVVARLGDITKNFQAYLNDMKLAGLSVASPNGNDKCFTHLQLLKMYDRQFRWRFNKPSVFDLNVEPHLHEWGETARTPGAIRKASNGYFKHGSRVRLRIKKAIYHSLTDAYPDLRIGSRPRTEDEIEVQRKVVVEAIESMPDNMIGELRRIGLGGLMQSMNGVRSSPLKVFEIYDRIYQKMTGDDSLFDLNHGYHLHKWGGKFRAPERFWQDFSNVETAIYHEITEDNPKLLEAETRDQALAIVRGLPNDLYTYFKSDLDIGGMMASAFKTPGERDSPRKVLEILGDVYGRNHGFASLVNSKETDYLQFNSRNRLIRTKAS